MLEKDESIRGQERRCYLTVIVEGEGKDRSNRSEKVNGPFMAAVLRSETSRHSWCFLNNGDPSSFPRTHANTNKSCCGGDGDEQQKRRSKDQPPGFRQNVETGKMEKDTKTQTGWQLDDFFEALQKDERPRRALQRG